MTATVLVVDDSLTVRMNLVEMLEAADFPVVACATGAEARKALAQNRFSLVILDVLLPDGDGVELLEEIRATPSASGTAVILLSTEVEIRDRVRGLTTGADEYVGKPYEPGYMIARAHELVRRSVGAPSTQKTELAQETVVLIDDSITFREALKAVLEAAAYRVHVAGTGEEGLRLAADMRPNAMIVDGVLPGIDGATVIRRVRLDTALRRLPCLLLTASEEARRRAARPGGRRGRLCAQGQRCRCHPGQVQRHAAQREGAQAGRSQETASLSGAEKKILDRWTTAKPTSSRSPKRCGSTATRWFSRGQARRRWSCSRSSSSIACCSTS